MKRFSVFLTRLFSILITVGLTAGLILSVFFVIGFCIGGASGSGICYFISDRILPYEYLLAEIAAIIGMIKMYLSKEKTFVMDVSLSDIRKKKQETNYSSEDTKED